MYVENGVKSIKGLGQMQAWAPAGGSKGERSLPPGKLITVCNPPPPNFAEFSAPGQMPVPLIPNFL